MLNFIGPLSGVATLTRKFVDAVSGTNAKIVCTRKTTPGFRALEKRAVRLGGGVNHRLGLDDAILIKDNHIAAAGGVAAALKRARASVGHLRAIEIEVENLDQLREALKHSPDAVLLDNMSTALLKEAVGIVARQGQDRGFRRGTARDGPGDRRNRRRLHLGRGSHPLGGQSGCRTRL